VRTVVPKGVSPSITARPGGSVAQWPFRGKIRQLDVGKSMTCGPQLSCFRSCATASAGDTHRRSAARVEGDLQSSPQHPGSVPFSVKETGDGLPRKSPRHNILTCLFPSSMVGWLSHGHRCLPSGDATQMIPLPMFIENGTDPGCCGELWASREEAIIWAPSAVPLSI
jgi:hypothetical protein